MQIDHATIPEPHIPLQSAVHTDAEHIFSFIYLFLSVSFPFWLLRCDPTQPRSPSLYFVHSCVKARGRALTPVLRARSGGN